MGHIQNPVLRIAHSSLIALQKSTTRSTTTTFFDLVSLLQLGLIQRLKAFLLDLSAIRACRT